MVKIKFLPSRKNVFAEKGKTILDLAFENDVIIEHNCGGLCACTSCRIIVLKGKKILSKKTVAEKKMLESDNFFDEDNRLACQCKIIKNKGEVLIKIPKVKKSDIY